MNNHSEELNTQQANTQDAESIENSISEDVPPEENVAEPLVKPKKKLTKKQIIIGAVALVSVIAIALVIFTPSKFEKVKNECVQIAGMVSGSGNYFMIDTYPDEYSNMDDKSVALLLPNTQKKALEAIQYANEALGFSGSVYSDMMNTTALMGRQSEENSKYKVSWTYHPDDGLEVTYTKIK